QPTPHTPPQPLTGTILITGATGALGSHIARHLVTHHGARTLALLSRQPNGGPNGHHLTTELQQLGATIHWHTADAADPHALAPIIHTHQHDLTTVIHAAGTLNDATLHTQTPHHLTTTL
ncbi:KR domain-containing protein, partial [Streptomyces sp. JWR5-1]